MKQRKGAEKADLERNVRKKKAAKQQRQQAIDQQREQEQAEHAEPGHSDLTADANAASQLESMATYSVAAIIGKRNVGTSCTEWTSCVEGRQGLWAVRTVLR